LSDHKSLVNFKKYIAELKKRHVFKAGLAYLVGAWVFMEVASLVLESLEAPASVMKTILIILVIGFPVWLIFSWVYDLTPEGIIKTKNTDMKYQSPLRSTSGSTGQSLDFYPSLLSCWQ